MEFMNEENKSKILGRRIKILRANSNMSQEDLGDKLKCSKVQVSNWETGTSLVCAKYLLDLPKIFDVNLSFFDPYVDQNVNV